MLEVGFSASSNSKIISKFIATGFQGGLPERLFGYGLIFFHQQDVYIFTRVFQPKPSFTTITGKGDN